MSPDLTLIVADAGGDVCLLNIGIDAARLLAMHPGSAFVVAAVTRGGIEIRFATDAALAAELVASCQPVEDTWCITMVPDAVRDCLDARASRLH